MWILLQVDSSAPSWAGDAEARPLLEATLQGAVRSTQSYGPWPEQAWTLHVHPDDDSFAKATGAPTGRDAAWVGAVLHLRPWERLRRRDIARLLRHEMTHRRLITGHLRRWEEEARCLHAEDHVRPPTTWPQAPDAALQARLDLALSRGGTALQAWAYRWLRAWLMGQPLPIEPRQPAKPQPRWHQDALGLQETVCVRWPENRLPKTLEINGQAYRWVPRAASHRFEGQVRFGNGPIAHLSGVVELRSSATGWQLRWHTAPAAWVAAASVGELQEDAPAEAKRALASVLARWLANHPKGHHADGSFCPLTHCAVVRGEASGETLLAAQTAPALRIRPRFCFFTGSTGGERLSAREVWGEPDDSAPPAEAVPGDRWGQWIRTFTPQQVARLKKAVRPGLRVGQKGLRLGASGPYAIESLRLAAGRLWGWTVWPSNAVVCVMKPDGSIALQGKGWGHNVGLDLALARAQAQAGMKAEEILRKAFGADAVD